VEPEPPGGGVRGRLAGGNVGLCEEQEVGSLSFGHDYALGRSLSVSRKPAARDRLGNAAAVTADGGGAVLYRL
jgi:hypothetical protein